MKSWREVKAGGHEDLQHPPAMPKEVLKPGGGFSACTGAQEDASLISVLRFWCSIKQCLLCERSRARWPGQCS